VVTYEGLVFFAMQYVNSEKFVLCLTETNLVGYYFILELHHF